MAYFVGGHCVWERQFVFGIFECGYLGGADAGGVFGAGAAAAGGRLWVGGDYSELCGVEERA